MIKVYVLPVTRIDNTDTVAGMEYIHRGVLIYDAGKATLIQDTPTSKEHKALVALALEVRDPTPEELAMLPAPPTDEELYQDELASEFNEVHEKAILALKNWDSLTLAQKDTILKNLLKWALWKDGRLTLGVL